MILVTGGCGFIGAPLVRRLLNGGERVVVVDNFVSAGPGRLPEHPGLTVVEADVRHEARIGETLDQFDVSEIIHLAALHFIPFTEEHPLETLEVNAGGTQSVLRAGLCRRVSRFLLASSAAVYRPSPGPCSETSPVAPVDVYGYSKWMAEAILESQGPPAGVSAVSMRLFNVYGPGDTNPHVIPHILEHLRAGGPVYLGNLDTRRDYIFVDDVVEAICRLRLAATAGYTNVNVGTGQAHSVREIVAALESVLQRRLEISPRADLARRADRPFLAADIGHLERILGWTPRVPLEDGLVRSLRAEGVTGLVEW